MRIVITNFFVENFIIYKYIFTVIQSTLLLSNN